jgi:outer membrane protein assembly factor BamD (BamD/ComL family)
LAPELAGQGWDDLAAFRLAMATFRTLEDDRTYYSGILETLDQLQAYLDAYPTGLHRIEAQEAHAQTRELLARHHLQVGDFYERIGNADGAHYHWRMAAGEAPDGSTVIATLVRGTDSARLASERLASETASS